MRIIPLNANVWLVCNYLCGYRFMIFVLHGYINNIIHKVYKSA